MKGDGLNLEANQFINSAKKKVRQVENGGGGNGRKREEKLRLS